MDDVTKLTTKDERVHYVVGLMRRNEWPIFPASRAFRAELAAQWGCSDSSVKAYAAEAHRIVALDPEERAELQERLGRQLLEMAEEARASKNTITNLPDFPSAIRATETAAKFLGIEFTTKVKLSGSVGLDSIDELRKRIDGGDAPDDPEAGG